MPDIVKHTEPEIKQRAAGMMVTTGLQGVGKTYKNMHLIKDYISDKLETKVRGRQALIFDTNGEYTTAQFAKNDVPNFTVKTIALKDVEAWSKANIVECRRIDASSLGMKEKRMILEYLLSKFGNGLLVLEDINTYVLNVTHMEEVVGKLVSLRHRAADVLISYQSLRAVEPRIWQNARWIRMHYQADNVEDIKGKVNNPKLMKIAQLIVNNRYLNGDKHFLVYIYNFENKIVGDYTEEEFATACRQYMNINKRDLKEHMSMHHCTLQQGLDAMTQDYKKLFYGN